MRGKRILILILLVILLIPSCNILREEEENPLVCGGIVELLYERVLPVRDPWADDLPGGGDVFHPAYGGRSFEFRKIGPNKYIANLYFLKCDPYPYEVWVSDSRVVGPSEFKSVARKIYLRIKGKTDWVELTCIVPNRRCDPGSKEAKFLIEGDMIKNPDPCE